MGKNVTKRHYSKSTIVFLTIIGVVFIALAIGVLTAIIKSCIKFGFIIAILEVGWFILVPIILFVIIPFVFGMLALSIVGKNVYHWRMEIKAKRYGVETVAQIIDYKVVSYNYRSNTRYALVLSYKDNNETKTFTTNYIFDLNEFKHLRRIKNIKVKVYKSFVVVTETFTEDVYQVDPTFHIELEFYQQKLVAITLKLWRICCLLAVAWLVVAIILTAVLNEGLYLIIAVCLLFLSNMPFAVVMAIYLIRWIWGKDKNRTNKKQNKWLFCFRFDIGLKGIALGRREWCECRWCHPNFHPV